MYFIAPPSWIVAGETNGGGRNGHPRPISAAGLEAPGTCPHGARIWSVDELARLGCAKEGFEPLVVRLARARNRVAATWDHRPLGTQRVRQEIAGTVERR